MLKDITLGQFFAIGQCELALQLYGAHLTDTCDILLLGAEICVGDILTLVV